VVGYLPTKSTDFFVLAACKTSYAGGLIYNLLLTIPCGLPNQTVSISGPFLDQGLTGVVNKKGQINPKKKPESNKKSNARKIHNPTFKHTLQVAQHF